MTSKRDDIRRTYRMLRVKADKPQWRIEEEAALGMGRYWRIENGLSQPTPEERKAIAKALGVKPSELPEAVTA